MEFVKKYIKVVLALLVALIIYAIFKPFFSVTFASLFDKIWDQPSFFKDPLRTHVTGREAFSWFFSTIISVLGSICSAIGAHWLITKYQKGEVAQATDLSHETSRSSITPTPSSTFQSAGLSLGSQPILSPQPGKSGVAPSSSHQRQPSYSEFPPPSSSPQPRKSGSAIQRQLAQNLAKLQLPPTPAPPPILPPEGDDSVVLPRHPSNTNFQSAGVSSIPVSGPVVSSLFNRARRGSDPGNPPSLEQRREIRASSMGGKSESPQRPVPAPSVLMSSSLRASSSILRVELANNGSPRLSPRSSSPLPGPVISPRGRTERLNPETPAPGTADDANEPKKPALPPR